MPKNTTCMKIFLKLKHWQIFLIWILSEILFISTIKSSLWIITIEIFGFVMIGWMYSIGKVINNLNTKNKIVNYRENLWASLYMISLIPFGYFYKNMIAFGQVKGIILLATGLIGFISGIKLINFSAKAYKQFDTKKELKFEDYSTEFFIILIMIIGIWIIQPKLNEISKKL
jgi:hypothetical protein